MTGPETVRWPERSPAPPAACEIAWELFDTTSTKLKRPLRNSIAITLATDEYLQGIKALLEVVVRAQILLTSDLTERIIRWSNTYAGHPDYAALQVLVTRLQKIPFSKPSKRYEG